jgi:outer membrane protein assembly factor BamD (BamD/ComL family)
MGLSFSARFIFAALLACFLVSCAGVPDPGDIPDDLTVADLIQRAQNSFDRGSVKAARMYYALVIERYSADPAAVVAAEYELAHLNVRQKKWQEALPMLDAIIQKYEADGHYRLPRAYLKLALMDREKIPQEKTPRK